MVTTERRLGQEGCPSFIRPSCSRADQRLNSWTGNGTSVDENSRCRTSATTLPTNSLSRPRVFLSTRMPHRPNSGVQFRNYGMRLTREGVNEVITEPSKGRGLAWLPTTSKTQSASSSIGGRLDHRPWATLHGG